MAKPTIRFIGFDDEWEQRKLSELSDFISKGATPTTYGYDWQESGIPFFRNDAIKDNQFIYGDFSYISEEANETLQRSEIHGDDILVAITGDIGKAGIVPKSIEKGNINQHTARVRIIKDAIPYFVYQSLITDEQQKKYQLIKTGLSMPQLSLQQIRDTIVLCPSVEEQSMIGECFINLDHLITLHQRKCDETKKLKKYMLQKMFPQNGSKVPEIRFKRFTDEWEQRKLDDVAEFSKGSGYSKGDLIESGTPIILYGRLYTKYETIISDVDTFVEAEDGSVYSKGGEVIIPASGETAEDIARAASVDKSGVLLGGDLNVVMPNKDINSAFLAISISNGSSQRELARKAQGKSVVHIHNEEIRNLVVPFPTMTEQNKIENYFTDLDHLITLHQRKCEELKKLKKFMLQNMFTQKNK